MWEFWIRLTIERIEWEYFHCTFCMMIRVRAKAILIVSELVSFRETGSFTFGTSVLCKAPTNHFIPLGCVCCKMCWTPKIKMIFQCTCYHKQRWTSARARVCVYSVSTRFLCAPDHVTVHIFFNQHIYTHEKFFYADFAEGYFTNISYSIVSEWFHFVFFFSSFHLFHFDGDAYNASVKMLLLWTMVLHANAQNSKHEIGFICNLNIYIHSHRIIRWIYMNEAIKYAGVSVSFSFSFSFTFPGEWAIFLLLLCI